MVSVESSESVIFITAAPVGRVANCNGWECKVEVRHNKTYLARVLTM